MALQEAPSPASEKTPRSRTPLRSIPQLKRNDLWWVEPMAVAIVLALFAIYATWRAFENNYFLYPVGGAHYLSPFYSPDLPMNWSLFGRHISPALYILPFPLLFRGTCYYYRQAYYRAFFRDPPACAVGGTLEAQRKNYTGEQVSPSGAKLREVPFVVLNLHRYAFYFAVIIVVILWWDAILAFDFGGHFGVGIGSLIFLANVVLLSLYTFSCHSWRHLSGGCINCFSCTAGHKARHGLWEKITHLNENHKLWAWCSLFSVVIVDLYVRFLCTGTLPASWGKPF